MLEKEASSLVRLRGFLELEVANFSDSTKDEALITLRILGFLFYTTITAGDDAAFCMADCARKAERNPEKKGLLVVMLVSEVVWSVCGYWWSLCMGIFTGKVLGLIARLWVCAGIRCLLQWE